MPPAPDTLEKSQLDVNGFLFDALAAGPKEGKLVLFLHGFPQFADAWIPLLLPVAAAGYRALSVDQRGYSPGARPRDVEAYAAENLVSDVLGFADRAGASTFHLVGHDWGGLVAWCVAADHPERLLSLTVLSTPHKDALMDAQRSDADQKWRSKYIPIFRSPGRIAEALLQSGKYKTLRAVYGGKLSKTAVSNNIRRLSEPYALTSALNWYRAMDLERRIGPVSVPTLYLWGSEDVALGRTAAEKTAAYVTGSYRFEPLEGKSHWLIEEEPELITDLLLRHLEANSQPRAAAPVERKPAFKPRVLLFDLNGTLLDTRALAPALRKMFRRKLSVRDWFSKIVTYAMAATLSDDYRPFDEIAIAVLEMEGQKLQVALKPADIEKIRKSLRTLPAFPDVARALRRMRTAKQRLGVLSNSSANAIGQQLENAGLKRYFEVALSVETVKQFKPALDVYRSAAASLQTEPAEILMVAAHPWDLLGAARAGFRTALVTREEVSTFPGAPPADFVVPTLEQLADQVSGESRNAGSKIAAIAAAGALAAGVVSTVLHSKNR